MQFRVVKYARVRPGAVPPQTLRGAAARFLQAQREWLVAGMPRARADLVATRRVVCLVCDQWDSGMWLGLGGCKVCWCVGRLKWAQSTASCPVGKWGPVR